MKDIPKDRLYKLDSEYVSGIFYDESANGKITELRYGKHGDGKQYVQFIKHNERITIPRGIVEILKDKFITDNEQNVEGSLAAIVYIKEVE
ncbi:hypothetical protein [Methylobacter sp.]|uniref:hypothetical protein n=1 Tax=Methylobacter sp. TaxID=2051955 RepID=UPI003DA300C8